MGVVLMPALFPIEALKDVVAPEFLQLAQERGVRFAVAELSRRENGDCVYLGETGCMIYERRPTVCRDFDCRAWFRGLTRNQRRAEIKSGSVSREVLKAARERMGESA
jgi:Fe-S-cluster containining protein